MPTPRDTYRQGLAALLADADRLGSTPDDIAARVVVLAELRHAIAAGLGEDAPVEQPKPSKGRLVWTHDGGSSYWLSVCGSDSGDEVCIVRGRTAAHYPGGMRRCDKRHTFADRATALRTAAEWARADGHECDDHPDAAPATAADAPTLPPGLTAEDGWIAWGGGECPCRDWPEVEYVMRGGVLSPYVDEPGDLNWWRTDTWIDIIAYRRHR